jgi:hypothetical protein
MFKKIITVVSAAFLVAGCVGAMPEYNSSNSNYIVFKTPSFAYADAGFVSKASSETKVEIYSSGQAIMRLRITPSQICMSKLKCMSASQFNSQVLHASYPADTLKNIFSGNEIFGGKGKKATANGFVQSFGSIRYVVNGNNINFSDSTNGVKIKVRSLN